MSLSDIEISSPSFVKHLGNVRSLVSPDDTCLAGLVSLYERCDTDRVIASQAHELLWSDSHDTVIRFTDWGKSADDYCLCFHSLLGLICTEAFKISSNQSQRDLEACVYNQVSVDDFTVPTASHIHSFGAIRDRVNSNPACFKDPPTSYVLQNRRPWVE